MMLSPEVELLTVHRRFCHFRQTPQLIIFKIQGQKVPKKMVLKLSLGANNDVNIAQGIFF